MTEHKITATDTAAFDRIVNAPVFFERNRVFRNYIGGEGFRALMGDHTGDNSFPEEWLASKVEQGESHQPRLFRRTGRRLGGGRDGHLPRRLAHSAPRGNAERAEI